MVRPAVVCLAMLLQGPALCSCGAHPLAAPTTAANAARAMLDVAAPVLERECSRPYQMADLECVARIDRARSAAEVRAASARCDEVRDALDRTCLPLVDAYRTARLSHAALVAALAASQGGSPDRAYRLAESLYGAAAALETQILALERKR